MSIKFKLLVAMVALTVSSCGSVNVADPGLTEDSSGVGLADSSTASDAATSDTAPGQDAASPDATLDSQMADSASADQSTASDTTPPADTASGSDTVVAQDTVGAQDTGPADTATLSCTSKADCPTGQTCKIEACGQVGVCFAMAGCDLIYQPVCGCDGKTYGNDCDRTNAGVGKKSEGECPTSKMCGGFAGFKCGPGEICDITGCYPDAAGACIAPPGACPKLYLPVCGCDGVTYGNNCERQKAGVGKDFDGPCKPTPPSKCGGKMGIPCAAGEWCDPDLCGADVTGVCKPIPAGPCPKTTPEAQQCGCDGKTWSNDCERQMNQMGKAYDGPCGAPAGCVPGVPNGCPVGSFCQQPDGTCAGNGKCTVLPDMCPTDYKPVCGCDGQTWSNSCTAQAAHVSIASYSACPSGGCTVTAECPVGQGCYAGTCGPCGPGNCPKIMCKIGTAMDMCTCTCQPVSP